jgi:4-amino-4-deoxy-L-arabinose transferase
MLTPDKNHNTASPQMYRWLLAAMLVFYIVIYLIPLGVRPLIVPDETRYTEIPREMLSTGDWVVPRYNGLRYFEKPPLGYWINAASIYAFGTNTFAARLPGALEAGLTTLLVFLFARATFRSRRLALYAALIHMSFFEVFVIGTINVLDTLLTLLLSAGIVTFYLAAQAQQRRRALPFWIASGVFIGLAFLAKGFLALAIPVIVMVPWMLWHGKARTLFTYGWLVVLVAALVAAPWSIMIQLQASDFWRYFFWVEHIKRFTAENAQHKAPFYYFLVVLPLLAFPWLALAPAAISGLRQKSSDTIDAPLLRFLWLWFLLPFLFFSASSGKLETYILPCFPPLAILIAVGLQRYFKQPKTGLFKAGVLINLICLAGALGALIYTQTIHSDQALYNTHETLNYYGLALSLIVVLLIGLISFRFRQNHFRLLSIAIAIVPVLMVAQFAFPDDGAEHKSPGVLLQQHINEIPKDAVVISDSYVIGSVALALNRQDIYLVSDGELAYGLSYPDAKGRLLTLPLFSKLLRTSRYTHTVVMVCSDSCNADFLPEIPANAIKYQYGIFDLWIIPKQERDHK